MRHFIFPSSSPRAMRAGTFSRRARASMAADVGGPPGGGREAKRGPLLAPREGVREAGRIAVVVRGRGAGATRARGVGSTVEAVGRGAEATPARGVGSTVDGVGRGAGATPA